LSLTTSIPLQAISTLVQTWEAFSEKPVTRSSSPH
jgi:hypothetical protein